MLTKGLTTAKIILVVALALILIDDIYKLCVGFPFDWIIALHIFVMMVFARIIYLENFKKNPIARKE
jgi:uncharacterized membrane protein